MPQTEKGEPIIVAFTVSFDQSISNSKMIEIVLAII